MKKVQYIFGALALITIPNWVQAQTQAKDTTLSRTVVVEQEYNPDIIDASKVNVLPKVLAANSQPKRLWNMMPHSHLRGNIPATTMEAYTGAESQDKANAATPVWDMAITATWTLVPIICSSCLTVTN